MSFFQLSVRVAQAPQYLCHQVFLKNSELEKDQIRLWNPLIAFVEKKYKFIFKVTNSIIPVKQKEENKGTAGANIKDKSQEYF